MLSRVADAAYWMSRYVERAESAARVLEVTRTMLIDLGQVGTKRAATQVGDVLKLMGTKSRTLEEAVFDVSDPASVISNLSRARENARQVREVISSEMWDHLNQAYWRLSEAAGQTSRVEDLSQTLEDVIASSYLWVGVTDATMRRGEGWGFIRIGQFTERADRTARLIGLACSSGSLELPAGGPERTNVGWLRLLRSTCAIEAFRKQHPTRVDPRQVLDFLLFDPELPRSLRYSVEVVERFTERLPMRDRASRRALERRFGRLTGHVAFSDVDDVIERGPQNYLGDFSQLLQEANIALQETYFLH